MKTDLELREEEDRIRKLAEDAVREAFARMDLSSAIRDAVGPSRADLSADNARLTEQVAALREAGNYLKAIIEAEADWRPEGCIKEWSLLTDGEITSYEEAVAVLTATAPEKEGEDAAR